MSEIRVETVWVVVKTVIVSQANKLADLLFLVDCRYSVEVMLCLVLAVPQFTVARLGISQQLLVGPLLSHAARLQH